LVKKFTNTTYNMSNLHILKENDKMRNPIEDLRL
jgi:hypothetical protein